MRAFAVCGLAVCGLARLGTPGVGVERRGFLGKGYGTMQTDLWTLESVHPTEFYRPDIPDTCFREWTCPRTEAVEVKFFDSVADFSRSFYSSFGIQLTGELMGIEGSLSASMQKSLAQYGENTKGILEMRISKRASCYYMRAECAFDPGNLNPTVLDIIATLPVDSANATAMELWDKGFIQRFGTHVSLDSVHGAQLKVIATSNSNQEGMEHFLKSAMQAYMSLHCGDHICGELAISSKDEEFDNRSLAEISYAVRCSAIGGSTAQSPCINVEQHKTDMEAHRLKDFFQSENLIGDKPVLTMFLEGIENIFNRMGYSNYSHALAKAGEYRRCRWPFHWAKTREEGHACKCQLTCQNGGEIDEDSCTCKPPSDELRGRTGSNRSQPLGTCQADPSSCGRGAGHCAVDGTRAPLT